MVLDSLVERVSGWLSIETILDSSTTFCPLALRDSDMVAGRRPTSNHMPKEFPS